MEWFIGKFVEKTKVKLKILDVGSYDFNGSYKRLFPSAEFDYIGIDMESGPNVGQVVNTPYHWPEFATDSFDLIISGQAFEHNEFFWLTMEEIARVLKPGGKVCLIAPNGFIEHRFPVDCYRFFSDGMIAMARYVQLDVEADSILVAQKNYSGEARVIDRKTYSCTPAIQQDFLGELKTYQKSKDNAIQKLLMKLYRKAKILG
jgi:SAM-dependent methyltransferase